ncbi:response regulator [Pseudomonas shirazica]|uniref:response regulator n=1 Tax=Pseudomonas shirazica TaxID=1940636 RepID=UPI0025A9E2EB|nr:response regulator [Pseudomonas shirazica]MDM9599706.1 response regulator [Pseudomonas shirazica]MDO2413134.1 response regulator [Pseudomonas shirazica]
MLKPILLVEDSSFDLELILVSLERSKLANEVVVARDGEEALDYLLRRNAFASRPEGNPAVVLLDLKLPKVNGLEVLEVIRSIDELRTIPVAMLTGSKMECDVEKAYGLGVNAYVVKPLEFKQFVSSVSGLSSFGAHLNEPPPGSIRVGIS